MNLLVNYSCRSPQSQTAGTAFGTKASDAPDLTWLLVVFPAAHLLSTPAALDELTETSQGLVDRLILGQCQLNHAFHFRFSTLHIVTSDRQSVQ